EQSNVVSHPQRILYRQRALFLKNNVVVGGLLNLLLRVSLVPMHSKRRAASGNQTMMKSLLTRFCQLSDKLGNVVPSGETVADEKYSERVRCGFLFHKAIRPSRFFRAGD